MKIIPSIGRTVHFVMPSGEHRPAIIVRVWDEKPTVDSVVQLQVFVDGSNDYKDLTVDEKVQTPIPALVWRTSVHQDDSGYRPGTFHAPEFVAQPASTSAPAEATASAGL